MCPKEDRLEGRYRFLIGGASGDDGTVGAPEPCSGISPLASEGAEFGLPKRKEPPKVKRGINRQHRNSKIDG